MEFETFFEILVFISVFLEEPIGKIFEILEFIVGTWDFIWDFGTVFEPFKKICQRFFRVVVYTLPSGSEAYLSLLT